MRRGSEENNQRYDEDNSEVQDAGQKDQDGQAVGGQSIGFRYREKRRGVRKEEEE